MGYRLLVIDDDAMIIGLLRRGLAYEGFTVDTATTGEEGLRLARGLLDHYEALWRGRIDRMTELIASTEETIA